MKHISAYITLAIVATLFAMVISSCNASKQFQKAHDKLTEDTTDYKHMAIPAAKCATWYPPKTYTREVIKFTKGKTDTVNGDPVYVYVDCDSIVTATLDEASRQHVQIKCPPQLILHNTDTIIHTVTNYVENTARITAQGYQIQDLMKQSGSYHDGRDKWRKWCLWTWGILAILIVLRIVWAYFKPKV